MFYYACDWSALELVPASDWLRCQFLAVVLASSRECIRRSVSCAEALVLVNRSMGKVNMEHFNISKPQSYMVQNLPPFFPNEDEFHILVLQSPKILVCAYF